jgi:RecG-like helicase
LEHFKLLDVQNTILNIHYPDNERLKNAAIHRVFFDRLLRIQIFSLMNKMNYQSTHKVMDSSQQWDILKEML